MAEFALAQSAAPLRSSLRIPLTLALGVEVGPGCPLWKGWRAAGSREVWNVPGWEGGSPALLGLGLRVALQSSLWRGGFRTSVCLKMT